MGPTSILLLWPTGDQASPVDQSLGSRLAATAGGFSEPLVLEQDSFRRGDLSDLERSLGCWAGKVSRVGEAGADVRSFPGCQNGWAEDVNSWLPDVVYLVYSDERLAVSMIQGLRAISKNLLVLLGRSLLRQSFLSSLGELAEGLLLVDLFLRGRPRNELEENFTRVLSDAGIDVPTANHGFGWDAMTLCGRALVEAKGDPMSAIRYLESGVLLEGVTGSYRFKPEDHNGRSAFNPTTLSHVRNSRVEAHLKIC